MIAADRERLSLILKYIDDNESDLLTSGVALMLNEARTIVDGHHPYPAEVTEIIHTEGVHRLPATFPDYRLTNAPHPGLDAFLTEPIHEYRDHIPTRHRHRAPNPWWLVVALTIAGILAIALTATPTTHPSPSHQTDPASPGGANLAPTRDTHGYTYPPRTP